jgi:parvulin-like peptidyl-prolyl isomerase
MSASKEKKGRQDQAATGWSDPKTAREAQQRKEEKRTNVLYGTIAVVFAVVAVICLIWRANLIPKLATAVTIDGEKYTAAEVNYYYKTVYQNFMSNTGSYASMLGLDTSASLKDQKINSTAASLLGATEGDTWYDYLMNQAFEQMKNIQGLCAAADKDGFTWTDDLQTQLDDSVSSLESSALQYGYSSLKQYLTTAFGAGMSEKAYRSLLKSGLLAQAYATKYQDGLTYSDSDLDTAYKADPKSFDVADIQYIRVDGSVATTDASGNTVEVTDAMKTAAMAAAKETADAIYASYKGGESLSGLANSDKSATYTDGTARSYSDTVLMNWAFDDSRKAGDSALLEDTDSSSYYVVTFSKRYRQEYSTVDVRHILIKLATATKKEGEDGYEDEQKQLKADAEKKAQDLLAKWKSGEATEDSFATLANENSEDTGSNTKGGLYTQIYKGEMVTEFNDWCFDASRKPGDSGIVYSESTGYHVMYFVGTDLPYWKVQVTNSLKSKDYNDWYTGLTKDYKVEQSSLGMKYVG